MKELWGILRGFLPWIIFGCMAGPPLIRLEAALAVSLLSVPLLGYQQLRRGFFLTWGSLLFFGLSLILVAWWQNLWVIRHMDVLARATLAAIAWVSILAGQPFTLQYARQNVAPEYWHTPGFIRTGYLISSVWGIIFLIALGASLSKPYLEQMGGWLYHFLATGTMIMGIIFTQWYVHRVRRARQT
jgi:hypothetical protein